MNHPQALEVYHLIMEAKAIVLANARPASLAEIALFNSLCGAEMHVSVVLSDPSPPIRSVSSDKKKDK